MTPELNRIHQGDALEILRTWPTDLVQCVVTSPPYWGLRDYGVAGQIGLEKSPEEYVARLTEVFREVRRVLRPDGTLWLNLGDSYTSGGRETRDPGNSKLHPAYLSGKWRKDGGGDSLRPDTPSGLKPKDLVGIPWRVAFALQSDGWYLRQDVIWAKPNPMPESVTDRPTRSHEYVFLLTRSQRYFYDHLAVREPCVSGPSDIRKMTEGKARLGGKTVGNENALCKASARTKVGTVRSVGHPEGRNRRSVWWIANHGFKEAHFATFPKQLIEPCILAGTRNGSNDGGDIVLDPFMGAGTTALVAAKLNRRFLGIELNPSYVEMAERRIRPELTQPKMF